MHPGRAHPVVDPGGDDGIGTGRQTEPCQAGKRARGRAACHSAVKTTKAKEAATDQVSDRTDDLMAALDAAREALARASTAAASKGAELSAELGKEASKAADKLMPERAKQRRREAARRRNRRLLAGTAALAALGVLASRLTKVQDGQGRRRLGPGPRPRLHPGRVRRGDPAARQRRRRPGADTAELAQSGRAWYGPAPCLTTRPSLARAAGS